MFFFAVAIFAITYIRQYVMLRRLYTTVAGAYPSGWLQNLFSKRPGYPPPNVHYAMWRAVWEVVYVYIVFQLLYTSTWSVVLLVLFWFWQDQVVYFFYRSKALKVALGMSCASLVTIIIVAAINWRFTVFWFIVDLLIAACVVGEIVLLVKLSRAHGWRGDENQRRFVEERVLRTMHTTTRENSNQPASAFSLDADEDVEEIALMDDDE